MKVPNLDQVSAFGRHVISFAMGAITIAATVNVVNTDQVNSLTAAISQIAHGVGEIAAGLAPIVAIISGLYAARTASPMAQIATVANNPEVAKVVVKDPAMAGAIPNAKVTVNDVG